MMTAACDEAAREQDLAQRCADGDRAAQREVFHRLRESVHRTLYRILGSNHDVPDLAQDTFVEIFRSIGSYRGNSRLAAWANVIAARVAYRYLSARKPRAIRLSVVPGPLQEPRSPERDLETKRAVRRLYDILDGLPPKLRIAFALHVVDGRPLRDVARTTQSSLVATKSRVFRARQVVKKRARRDASLRALLREAGEESP